MAETNGRSGLGHVAPPVCIGLPVFNGERFLAQAVESILDQDYTSFDLVISDNGSTDGTEEIGRHYAARDTRVTYIRHSTNRGWAWNFNYLVATTSGPLFKWAAHDDELCPSWLSRCVAALDAAPDAVVAYTRRTKIDADGNRVAASTTSRRRKRFLDRDCSPGARFADFLVRTTSCTEAFGVIRRSTLERTRLLLPVPAADRVLLAELLLRGRFVEVPEELFRHREHPDRTTRKHRTPIAQAAWADPCRDRLLVLPTWRLGVEFARAIRRVPLGRDDRRMAYAGLAVWARRRALVLADNFVDAARARPIE